MINAFFTPPRLVMGVFFMHAVMISNWLPRIPDVQARLAVGTGDLALGFLGMPLGSFCALLVAGPLVEKLTPRRTIVFGFCLYAVALPPPGFVSSVPMLFIALAILGFTYPLIDVAMNTEAARIQESIGRPILSTCHGFWSIGSMIGALAGSAFGQFGVDPGWHLLGVAIVSLPVAIAFGQALPEVRLEKAPARRMPFALPTVGMIGLCVVAFGSVLIEGSMRNWSAIFLRDVLSASPFATGLGFGAFSLAMAVGRLAGDRLTDRFGPIAVARACCLFGVVGLVLMVTAGSLPMAIVGMSAAGIGVAVLYPLSITAAAARGDRAPALNVAALSLGSFGSSLVGPPLIGFVSEAGGLRWGFATLLPAIVASAVLANELRRRAALTGP